MENDTNNNEVTTQNSNELVKTNSNQSGNNSEEKYHKRQGVFEIFELNLKITHQLAKGVGEIELIQEI